ncbi:MAG TPA: tRNA pseudouridine(38-40) synthase TruA [Fibrobacteria bacterium]|nr:tRNA pseudouridine(38-40) synthase TruA [Fibrobacteria bacterium]HOX50876.1 tRNA pseudouridine(38-40) synthase TruA [Fibrobacteria bacterium]
MSEREPAIAESLPRWRMRVAYDGRPFLGWQRQEQGMTVQEGLETALAVALRHPVVCTAAGRTDTGVHARGQVVHFCSDAVEDPGRILRSARALVPRGISVRDLEPSPLDFSARYSAVWREYCYRIRTSTEPLDPPNVWFPGRRFDQGKLARALEWFHGEHDFKAFCIPRDDGRHTRCTLLLVQAVEVPGGVDLWIRGNRFLHRMVRSMVGFCLDVSRDRMGLEEFQRLISGESLPNRFWAPPDGLTLERVGYPDWTEPPLRGQPDA